MIGFIKNIIFLGAAAYVAVLAYFVYTQRDYIYHPKQSYQTPEEAGAPAAFQEAKIVTEDRLTLTGWYARATRKPFTLLVFHGNGDSVQNIAPAFEPYIDAGYGVMLAEYRGYSKQPGKPDENGLYADGRAYMSWLFDKGVEVDRTIILGHSLGTGVATQVGREFHPAGLVLLAPFRSIPDIADKLFRYFPTKHLVFDRFSNAERLPTMREPLLIVHGDSDNLVPLAQGQSLFDEANEPKQIEILGGVGHNDIIEASIPVVMDWLDSMKKARGY